MLWKWRIFYPDGEIVELWRVRCPSRFARSGGDTRAFDIKLISLVASNKIF